MINEFYAALLNHEAKNSQPGHDWVPANWSGKNLSREAELLRDCLLVDTSTVVAQNWRAAELRTIVEGTDLASMLSWFDQRTGYMQHDIVNSMTKFFKPRVIGQLKIDVRGSYKSNAYRIDAWHFSTDTSDLTVDYGNYTQTVTMTGNATRIDLPGADAVATVTTAQNAESSLTWAAVPITDVAATAEEIRESKFHLIDAVSRKPSTMPQNEVDRLRDVAKRGEAATSVAAATLMYVAHVLSL